MVQLDPALAVVLRQARPFPLGRTFKQPPRGLLDQRQAVEGCRLPGPQRLARQRRLAEILRVKQGGQQIYDVGVEQSRLDGGHLLPLHGGIASAGHGC